MTIRGCFETHLTVPFAGHRLAEFANEHGMKLTHIELDRGKTPSQPMVTFTGSGSGSLARQRRLALALERSFTETP